MEFNVGGLKWSAFALVSCLIGLPFLHLSRFAYWALLICATCGAYAIGSHLLIRHLRREIQESNQDHEQ